MRKEGCKGKQIVEIETLLSWTKIIKTNKKSVFGFIVHRSQKARKTKQLMALYVAIEEVIIRMLLQKTIIEETK